MTGWRLGVRNGPGRLVVQMAKLQQFSFDLRTELVQHAGVVCSTRISTPRVDAYRKARRRRGGPSPKTSNSSRFRGAFYAFPRLLGTATEFVAEAIRRNSLIIPGNVFSSATPTSGSSTPPMTLARTRHPPRDGTNPVSQAR